MSLTKKYLKNKPACKVTFRVPNKAAKGAKKVAIAGDFNEWKSIDFMEKLKNGDFKKVIELHSGSEYQFRYLIDGKSWENDWAADKYVPSGVSEEENSVVVV